MSTGTIKSLQQSGTTWEALVVLTDDGSPVRVQTNGTLASLVAGLQVQTSQATALKTKPELSVGQLVDFTPVVPVVVIPTQAEIDRNNFFDADRRVTVLQADQAKGYAIDTDALAQAQKQAAQLYQSSYRT